MTEPLTDGKKPISKKAAKGSRKRTDKSSKSKVPKQLRSQKTRSRILKAARNLFAQRGYYQVNSNQIAAEAGVSVGTFYTYFKDKKEILLEILHHFYKHFWADVSREAQNDLPESYDLKLVLRSIVKKSFEAIDHDPDFSRLVYSMKFYDDDIRKTFEEIEKREVNHAAFTLGFSQGAITVKDRKAAALIVMKLIESLGLSDFPIDREVLVDEVTKMIYLYFTQS